MGAPSVPWPPILHGAISGPTQRERRNHTFREEMKTLWASVNIDNKAGLWQDTWDEVTEVNAPNYTIEQNTKLPCSLMECNGKDASSNHRSAETLWTGRAIRISSLFSFTSHNFTSITTNAFTMVRLWAGIWLAPTVPCPDSSIFYIN